MSRKSKIDPVEKVKIVERYLNGKIGISHHGDGITGRHHGDGGITGTVLLSLSFLFL